MEGSFIGLIQSMKITKRGKKTNICAVCDSSSIYSIFMFVHLINVEKLKLLLTMCIETLNYIAEDSYYCWFKFCTYDFFFFFFFEIHLRGIKLCLVLLCSFLSLKNPSSHQTTTSWLLDSHKIHSIKQVVYSIILIQREFQGELSSLSISYILA